MDLILFQMWPSIIEKARIGGLNTIQTYVFWNVHEPEQGKVSTLGYILFLFFVDLIIYWFILDFSGISRGGSTWLNSLK